MNCVRCGENTKQNKPGYTKSDSQRYMCMHCKKSYSPEPKKREYSEDFKLKAIKIYLEGNSCRAVGRIMGIGKNVVLNWIKQCAKKLVMENPKIVDIIEMDELYTFLGDKKNKDVFDDTCLQKNQRDSGV